MSNRERFQDFIVAAITIVGIFGSIVSVIVAGYLVVSYVVSQNQPSQSTILASILSVMLFIAISNLDRYLKLRRIDIQSEKTRELIENRILKRVRASELFDDKLEVNRSYFSTASQIYISGITLGNTIRSFVNDLSQRLAAGAHIKVILISKEDDVIDQIIRRSFGDPPPDRKHYRDRIDATLTLLRIIAGTQPNPGTLEVGLLPYVPSIGFTIIDPDTSNGKAIVEIYHHNSPKPSPKFLLLEEDDPKMFFEFKEQFDLMWDRTQNRVQFSVNES